MFGQSSNLKDEFITVIEASIVERQGNICDT